MAWDWLQRVIVISLREETGRRRNMENELSKAGLLSKLEWFIAERHPEGGRQGCHESHVAVVKRCVQLGLSRVLIMEDDAKFINCNVEKESKCLGDFVENSKFSKENAILYLGYMLLPTIPKLTSFSCVYSVKKAVLMHAYIPSAQCLKTLLKTEYTGIHIDRLWGMNRIYVKKRYVIKNMMFTQNNMGSSVTPMNRVLQKTIGFARFNKLVNHLSLYILIYGAVFLLVVVLIVAYVVHLQYKK